MTVMVRFQCHSISRALARRGARRGSTKASGSGAESSACWRGNAVIVGLISILDRKQFLARNVIYTSRAYATMCVCPSVCDGSALAHDS